MNPVDDNLEDAPELLGGGGKVDQEALFRLYEQQRDAGDDDTPVTVRFILARDLNKRLDKYLVDRVPFLSRTSIQKLVREEAVTVNGRVPKPSTNLRKGDEIIAILPPPPSTEIPAEEIPLDILFEDDHLIIINKQADIITHPARGNRSGTLINGLAWHFQHRSSGGLSKVGEEFARPGVVHRLDRHTTGVMVFAKTETAHWRLAHQFEHRKTEKRYLAIVHGRLEPYADVIDVPLGKHMTVREKYAVRWDETGKPSVTIYRVREVYDKFTLVELELKTGRTHQIRVHLSHLGYPIAGDDMYGGEHVSMEALRHEGTKARSPTGRAGEGANSVIPAKAGIQHKSREGEGANLSSPIGRGAGGEGELLLTRQALHSALLGFTHPITNQVMEFQAPLPPDMRNLISRLRENHFIARPNVAGTKVDVDALLNSKIDSPSPQRGVGL